MVKTCLLAGTCTEGRSPIRCRSRYCTQVISKPFYNRLARPPPKGNDLAPPMLTLNRYGYGRDRRSRSYDSRLSKPDRKSLHRWRRSLSPSRAETQAAPRPHSQSVPPTTGLDTGDSSRSRKRSRESPHSPSRSECRVQIHVHSPFIKRRRRRTYSPKSYSSARLSAFTPRALKPKHARRPSTASRDVAPLAFVEGSLSGILLTPEYYPEQYDRLVKVMRY